MPHRGRRWSTSSFTTALSPPNATLSSSTTLPPALPTELIDHILHHFEYDWRNKKADLARLCLVSRSFLHLVQPRLYRTAVLRLSPSPFSDASYYHDHGTPRLVEVLQGTPNLAKLVRRIELLDFHGPGGFTAVVFVAALTAMLDSCQAMTELSVTRKLIFPFYRFLHRTVTAPKALSHIKVLELDTMSDVAWFCIALLSRWSNIQRLVVDSGESDANPSFSTRQPISSLRPYCLHLSYSSDDLGPFLDSLYSSVAPTLTRLHLSVDLPVAFPPFATFSRLRYLRVHLLRDGPRSDTVKALATSLRSCASLEQLVVDPWPASLTLSNVLLLTSASSSSSLAASLPPSLQILHFRTPHVYPADLVRLINAARQAVNLRQIGIKLYQLPKGKRDRKKRPELPSAEEKEELREVCEERGIKVVALPR
ncbi:hypothetical protein JCM11251_005230 [Rhodosporidiobolus azoricus]